MYVRVMLCQLRQKANLTFILQSQRNTTSAETEDEVLRELEKAQAELRKVVRTIQALTSHL